MVIKIDNRVRKVLREVLSEMVNPVDIMVFSAREDCEYCEDTITIVKALVEESGGKISLTTYYREKEAEVFEKYGIDRVPTVALLEGYIRYTGIPAGEEFKGLVDTIIKVSKGDSGLSGEVVSKLRRELVGAVYVEVIVTPTCPYCPMAAVLSNMFALEAKGKVVSDIVEGIENSDIAYKYGVTAVPSIALNGELEFIGVPDEDSFLEALIKYQKAEYSMPIRRPS